MGSREQVVLVLAPHTDDGEFGCGGTIARLVEEGHPVSYVAFSSCKTSLPAHLPPDTLIHEARRATQRLRVKEFDVLDYRVRHFSESRQPILEDMVKLKARLNPWLVLAPASTDIHQDHQTIHNEAKRAFKQSNILGFELPWNNITMTTTLFSKLTEAHIQAKTEAVLCYESQSWRQYYSAEFVRSLAFTRGTQVGTKYAEAFEVVRWIL